MKASRCNLPLPKLNYLMKAIAIVCLATLTLFACKKEDKHEGQYKVTYSVTGQSVTQFDITNNFDVHIVAVPFNGTRDTTVYLNAGTNVKLDAKANAATQASLSGTIKVDDTVVATLTDSDADADGKTQVKI